MSLKRSISSIICIQLAAALTLFVVSSREPAPVALAACPAPGSEVGTLDTIHLIPPIYARDGLSTSGDVRDHYLYISTPEVTPFEVTIQDANGFNGVLGGLTQTGMVSKAAPLLITLSAAPFGSGGYGAKTIVSDADLNAVSASDGLIVTAPEKFYANIRHLSGSQGTSLTAKGQTAFGKRFRSGHVFTNTQELDVKSHFISVMATEDDTEIDFSDLSPGITLVGNVTDPGPVTLDKYETYTIGMRLDEYTNSAVANDLNGTLVTSDKPVVVNVGSFLAGAASSGRDIGSDQIVPIPYLGTKFIVAKGAATTNANVLEVPIVVADSDDTEIYLKGSSTPVTTIDAGEYYAISGTEYPAGGSMFIRTSKPAYVYQSTSSNNTNGNGMNFVAAIQDNLETQNLLIPAVDQLGAPTISVVAPTSATIVLNSVSLTGGVIVPGNAEFYLYTVNGQTGNVEITGDEPYFVSTTSVSGNIGAAGFFVGFPNSYAVKDITTTEPQTAKVIPVLDNDVVSTHTFTIDSICEAPDNGIAQINGGSTITYIPNAGFTGVDSFKYIITNGAGLTDVAEVLVGIDSDGDGEGDQSDIDDDNDGIPDDQETGDTDGDGIDDRLDLDSDNDGIFDVVEAGHSGADANKDGRIDSFAGDNGLPDVVETVAESSLLNYTIRDTDLDGLPDFKDLDSDGDGLPDNIEAQTAVGYIEPNATYNAATGIDTAYPNGLTPFDTDGDGFDDYRDTDSDDDTESDTSEAGLTLSGTIGTNGLDNSIDTADNYDDVNGNINDPEALPDSDGDGLVDAQDPNDINIDTDGDGIPDGADADTDGDGTLDNGIDTDGDGINDTADVDQTSGTDVNGDGIDDAVIDPADADNDGVFDEMDLNDGATDSDGDGIPDRADVDRNNDATADNGIDSDGDGVNDYYDPHTDTDGDGVSDLGERAVGSDPTDGDDPLAGADGGDGLGGTPATDADGDNVPDAVEVIACDTYGICPATTAINATTDTDGDGVYDWVEIQLGLDPTDGDDPRTGADGGDGSGGTPPVDADDDGVPDAIEQIACNLYYICPALTAMNAMNDKDGDGAPDWLEISAHTDPLVANSPVASADGGDGPAGTPPLDADDDGVYDSVERILCILYDLCPAPTALTGLTDTDGDGLTDEEELLNGTDPNDANSPTTGGSDDDDADGVTNAVEQQLCDEYLICPAPTAVDALTDTDGDGVTDEDEIIQGSDPTDPSDTTTGDDDDTDNVDNTIEDGAPNGGDGNNDGFLDSDQNNVTSIINKKTTRYNTVQTSANCNQIERFVSLEEEDLTSANATYNFPVGLWDIRVVCDAPGAAVGITLFLDQEYSTTGWTYLKYDTNGDVYADISGDVTYGTATISGATVTTIAYSVTDGGPNDQDGIANGVIIDPAGPGATVAAPAPGGGGGRSQSGGGRRSIPTYHSVTVNPLLSCREVTCPVDLISLQRGRLQRELSGRSVVFTDENEGDWHLCSVNYLMEHGMAHGYKDQNGEYTGEFKPGNNVTYAEVIKMSLEAVGYQIGDTPDASPENRSARGQWSAGYIEAAEQLGVSLVTPRLNVNEPARRGEVLQILSEIMGMSLEATAAEYQDVSVDHPYAKAIGHFTKIGCVQGDTDEEGNTLGLFRPDEFINRAEVSKILMKIHGAQVSQ